MKKINYETIHKIATCIKNNFFGNEELLSVRRIADKINIPYQTVWYYLNKMINNGDAAEDNKYGYILKKHVGEDSNTEYRNVQILGEVPCGEPSIADLFVDDYIKVPSDFIFGGDYFALKAKGDSMIKIGIENGDYVLVQKQKSAAPGQVVVILSTEFSDSGVTLKRYYPEPEKNRIRLHPENDLMEDFFISVGEVQGIAKKVIKIKDIS